MCVCLCTCMYISTPLHPPTTQMQKTHGTGRLRAEYVQPIVARNREGLIQQGLSDPNKIYRLLKTLGPGALASAWRVEI